MKFSALIIVVCVISLALVFRIKYPEPVFETRFIMNTNVSLVVYAASETQGKSALHDAFTEMTRIEKKYSISTSGWLAQINKKKEAPADSETIALIVSALDFSRQYPQTFDCTMGKLKKLWNIGSKNFTPPGTPEIADTLHHCGYKNIAIEKNQVRLLHDAELDFGAFVKGYAADCAAKILKNRGIRHFLIEAGGDIVAFGGKPSGEWSIGIKHPQTREIAKIIKIHSGAIATSGIYERVSHFQNVSYHHIFSPVDGYPAANGLASASAVCNTAMYADMYATMLMIQPQSNIKNVLNTQLTRVITITTDGMLNEYP